MLVVDGAHLFRGPPVWKVDGVLSLCASSLFVVVTLSLCTSLYVRRMDQRTGRAQEAHTEHGGSPALGCDVSDKELCGLQYLFSTWVVGCHLCSVTQCQPG